MSNPRNASQFIAPAYSTQDDVGYWALRAGPLSGLVRREMVESRQAAPRALPGKAAVSQVDLNAVRTVSPSYALGALGYGLGRVELDDLCAGAPHR